MSDPIIPPVKRCTKCNIEYPATSEFFNKNCLAKDGFHPNCKVCRSRYREENAEHIYEQKKRWRENNPEREKARVSRWIEANPERYKETCHQYYIDHREERLAQCKLRYYRNHAMTLAKRKEYYHKNRERILKRRHKNYMASPEARQKAVEKSRQWAKQNPLRYRASMKVHKANRRAREIAAEGAFTAEDIRIAYRSQHGKCWHCFKPVGSNFHPDHLISLKRGGSNWPNNIVISCPVCNLSKGAKSTQEWNGRLF